MEMICKTCYRREPEIKLKLNASESPSEQCITCYDMIGKGAGYGDGLYSDDEINNWLEGAKQRRELFERGEETQKQTNIIDALEAHKYIDKFHKELIVVPIKQVVPNKWNPNRHSPQNFATLVNSIKKFGFNDPISVRVPLKTDNQSDWEYEIVDGEHRWQACKELGFTQVQVINFGEITREEAMTLTQLMNLRGSDDVLMRAKMLKELKSQTSLFDLMPGTEKEKEEELKLLDFDFSQFDKPEDTEEKKSTDLYTLGLKKALELEIVLMRIYEETDDIKLKTAITQYYTFAKMLKTYIK